MPDLIHEAMAHVTAQRFEQALEILQPLVESDPQNADALHLIGVAYLGRNDAARALESLERAVAVDPTDYDVQNNRALALRAVRRVDDAEAAARCATELEPDRPEARNTLGTILEEMGRKDEALAAYRAATEADPEYAIGHINTGRLLSERDDLPAAIASYERATEAEPTRQDAWLALGRIATWTADYDAAKRHLRRALLLGANDPDTREALADALQLAGELPDAIGHYKHLIASHPERSGAWYALGCAHAAQREYALALPRFQGATRLDPKRAEAHFQLGKASFETGLVTSAIQSMARTLELGSANVSASGNLPGAANVPGAATVLDMALDAIATFVPGDPAADANDVREARAFWGGHRCPPLAPERAFPARGERLRVGYVSAFFRKRNWMKPVRGLVDAHDRERVEVHLFSDDPPAAIRRAFNEHTGGNEQTGESEQQGNIVHDTQSMDDAELARCVQDAGIDVLVDLNGYSRPGRLRVFAHRPAPVTLAWFNNYATLGVPGLDHTVGDNIVLPPGEEDTYTETVHRLSGTYLPFEVRYPVPSVSEPPAAKRGVVTFGCLGSLYKFTPAVLDAWAQIVVEVPDSRLLLRNAGLSERGMRGWLIEEMERRGVARSRLSLDGAGEHVSFLRTYDQVDLALDPFPYNGGTTTMEALWQGVPVLCFHGDRWAGRISASLMTAAGLADFVSPDLESHIARAIELGRDTAAQDRLAELRAGLRERLQESAACDTRGLARQMEDLYDRLRG